MTTEHEYNPETCWTAKQLREFGYAVPKNIPDCGWVTKASCKIVHDFERVEPKSGYSFGVAFDVTFTEAFRWIECSVSVEKESLRKSE